MPKLILEDAGARQVFELPTHGRCRIGRSRHSDLQLNHPSVSENHCQLDIDPMVMMVTDLGSTNGTFIDGKPVQKGELVNGQVLSIGAMAMIVELESQRVVVHQIAAPEARPTSLENGAACCYQHSDVMATMQCTHCQKYFCQPCVHTMGLKGGRKHYFCPVCHNHCVPYTFQSGKSSGGFFVGFLNAWKKITGRFRN